MRIARTVPVQPPDPLEKDVHGAEVRNQQVEVHVQTLLHHLEDEWKSSRAPARLFNGYARQLGLDEARFASCHRADRGGKRTARNNRAADALRVRATPSFFVNGRLVEGALPAEQFRQLLSSLAGTR